MYRLSKTCVMCCPRWYQFIFSPLTGINIIKGRGVWMSAHHLPVERKQHVWYAPHRGMADVHHLLILLLWRRLQWERRFPAPRNQCIKGQKRQTWRLLLLLVTFPCRPLHLWAQTPRSAERERGAILFQSRLWMLMRDFRQHTTYFYMVRCTQVCSGT